jgi:signal transduction histidine kinase
MAPPAILFVDDDPLQLELMSHIAEQTFPGARTTTTSDPTAVGALCREQRFDCVFIDYKMPQMDGLACAQRLRQAFPYLPIILCTGRGDEMLAAHAMTSGVTDYLPKSRLTQKSLRRSVTHAIHLATQSRIIDEQRRELENFAFALAHDFKQPIRQIRTFASLITEAVRADQMTDIEQHLGFLNEAARRLGNLVDVMSQYTLLNNPPTIGEVDLNAVLAGVRASIGPYLEERGGRLIVADAPCIRGNETLMHQVLQNLVVNGLKYNQSGEPTVTVTTASIGAECLITVADNGIGIDAAHLEAIFDPLARLHSHAEYEGSGLGLTLARKAITAQQGTISCASRPGVGSEFMIRVPLAGALTAASAEPALTSVHG